jgi:hypothetical protein
MADRTYTISVDNITVVAAPQLVFMNVAAGGAAVPGYEILRCWCSQRANATSAQQGIKIHSKITAFPTGLTTTAPSKTSTGLPTANLTGGASGAAGTCGTNSTGNGAGTEVGIYNDNFNVLNGWLWVPTPAETILSMPSNTSGHGLEFTSTPGALTAWSWGLAYREIG